MEVYWSLASADANEREAATLELVRNLLQQQQDHDIPRKKHQGSKGEKEKPEKKPQSESPNPGKQEERASRKRKEVPREPEEEEEATTNNLMEEKGTHTAIDSKGEGSPALMEEESSLDASNPPHSNGNLLHDTLAEEDGLHNCSPSVQYALRRLVRGVASSRECARQGFAMALASLLEALPWLKIGSVLKLIHKTVEISSSMNGQEKRDGLLGQLFALGAVIRSYRPVINAASMEDAKEITEHLLLLAKRKAFLREPAITVLMHFFEKLPPGVLQDNVLKSPLLQETVCMDIGNANADTLLLVLRLHKWLPSSVVESCPLLPKSKNICALFEASHLRSLVPVLKDSSSCHPRLHPVWNLLVELLLQESSDLEQLTPSKKKKKRHKHSDDMVKTADQQVAIFWKLVVDDSLLPSSHERKYLAMELVQLLLPKLSASCARFILSKTLVRCLLDVLAAKGNLLYKSAQTCLACICEWAKSDEARIVTAIISLQQASHGKFDTLSKMKIVKELVSLLKSREGCFLLYNKLMELFNCDKGVFPVAPQLHILEDGVGHNGVDDKRGKEKDDAGSDVKSVETRRHWVIEQIVNFAKETSEPNLRSSIQKETLKFLTANALFVGPLGMKCYLKELQVEFHFPELSVSENTRKLCLARLQSILVNFSSVVPPSQAKANSNEKTNLDNSAFLDLRFHFLELCDMFDEISEVSRVQPVSEDGKQAICSLRSCLSQLCSLVTEASNDQTRKIRAMSSLLMQLLLQSVTTQVNDITSELILCCRKAFGEQIKVDTINDTQEEEPEAPFFMDVLVELLLSLLAQSSAPIRAAAEQVFKAFTGDLTETNVLSLLKVVKKQLNPGRRIAATPLDTGDSDEDQFLDLEDSDGDDDNDDDNDDDDEEDDEVLKERKPKGFDSAKLDVENKDVKKGSESAVHNHEMSKDTSDLEDNSSSDMDDEAMFKIDVHLANLLKQRKASNSKGEGKDAQTQLLYFKFRVLSLLEYFFLKRASSPLCLTSLPHLLKALVVSSTAGGNGQFADKISSILQGRLFKAKEYPKGDEVDKAVVASLLQKCMKLALRSKIKRVGQVAQSCSLWLMKVFQGKPSQNTKGAEDLQIEIQNALNDFFYHRCCLKAPFFHEVFVRFPGIGVASLGMLLESCRKARTEFLQNEALQLVNFILQAHCGKGNGQFRDSLLQSLPAMSELLVYLIEKPPSNKIKKSEIRRFCVSVIKAVAQELPDKPVKKHVGKVAYDLCISHFGASIMDGVTSKGVKSADEVGNKKKKVKQKSSKE